MSIENIIIGSTIIVMNLIPILLRKYKYTLLTSVLSLLLILLLKFIG